MTWRLWLNDHLPLSDKRRGVDPGAAGTVLTMGGDGLPAWEAGGDGGVVRTVRVRLSSADLLALDGSPFRVVDAPGAGRYIVPLSVTAVSHFGTAAYLTDGEWPILAYGGLYAATESGLVGLGASADALMVMPAEPGGDLAAVVDCSLDIKSQGTLTEGDGSVEVSVTYVIHETDWSA